jgi:CheY-like chemotaxis protein
VIVVDNEPWPRTILLRALDAVGIPAVACASAHEALAELEAGGVTVIVTDQRMPVMPGDVLLGIVRDRYPAVARVLWSAFVTSDLIDNAPACLILSKTGNDGGHGSFIVDTVARLHRGAP